MVGYDTDDNIRAAGVLFGGNTVAAPWKTYFSSIQRVQAFMGSSMTRSCPEGAGDDGVIKRVSAIVT